MAWALWDPLPRAPPTMLMVLNGMFAPCGHPDHSRPTPTFTRERDLDAQRPQERLRPSQSTGQRSRVLGPWATTRNIMASTLRA
jgi:hypothetical protein